MVGMKGTAMGEFSENEVKVRNYIVRQIKENQNEYFTVDEISSALGLDENIVIKILIRFRKEKRIKIKYIRAYHDFWGDRFWWYLIRHGWFEHHEHRFKLIVLDEKWFET